MDIDKSIRIRCESKLFISLADLRFFQKKLKSIDEKHFRNLKESIKKDGIPLGFHVWQNTKDKVWDIMDGHHRYLALVELEREGWFVPPLPCTQVFAKDKKEAAKVVLLSNHKAAEMSRESLSDFMIDFELGVDELELLDFSDVDLNEFLPSNDPQDPPNNNSGELDLDEFNNFDHKCPKCGFEWNDGNDE